MSREKSYPIVLDPQTRIHVRIGVTEEGDIEWFVVQLLHNLEPYYADNEDWREIARFDHNPDALDGHDVVEEGLHMDLTFENRENKRDERFPGHHPTYSRLGGSVEFCVSYLSAEYEKLVREYENDLGETR